jgi:hypothetical protein
MLWMDTKYPWLDAEIRPQLVHGLRTMNYGDTLFKLIKAELTLRGNWKNKPRGNGGGFVSVAPSQNTAVAYFDEESGEMKYR